MRIWGIHESYCDTENLSCYGAARINWKLTGFYSGAGVRGGGDGAVVALAPKDTGTVQLHLAVTGVLLNCGIEDLQS